MNGNFTLPSISTDALSRLAAVAGDTFYSRRISTEDEGDRHDATAHSLSAMSARQDITPQSLATLNLQHYPLPQFRESTLGIGDLSAIRSLPQFRDLVSQGVGDLSGMRSLPQFRDSAPQGVGDLSLMRSLPQMNGVVDLSGMRTLPQFRDSAPQTVGDHSSLRSAPHFGDSATQGLGDHTSMKLVNEEPANIPAHPSDTGNTGRFPPPPLGFNDLQMIEVERRKLLGYEDELILQDHILTHEKILLQKKIEEASLFAVRQMRLFTKDELTTRFYDIEKIICRQDISQRFRENGKQQLNANDVSGLRSVLHRILIEETMPLTWNDSRFPSNRDLNLVDAMTRSSHLQSLEQLKDSSLWNGRATSSLIPSKFATDHHPSNLTAIPANASPSTAERVPLDSMLQDVSRKRSFQEEFELQNGQNHGSVPDPLAYLYKKSRPESVNDSQAGNGSKNENNQNKST